MQYLTEKQHSARSMRMQAQQLLERATELDGNHLFMVACKHESRLLGTLLLHKDKPLRDDVVDLIEWGQPGYKPDDIYAVKIHLEGIFS